MAKRIELIEKKGNDIIAFINGIPFTKLKEISSLESKKLEDYKELNNMIGSMKDTFLNLGGIIRDGNTNHLKGRVLYLRGFNNNYIVKIVEAIDIELKLRNEELIGKTLEETLECIYNNLRCRSFNYKEFNKLNSMGVSSLKTRKKGINSQINSFIKLKELSEKSLIFITWEKVYPGLSNIKWDGRTIKLGFDVKLGEIDLEGIIDYLNAVKNSIQKEMSILNTIV